MKENQNIVIKYHASYLGREEENCSESPVRISALKLPIDVGVQLCRFSSRPGISAKKLPALCSSVSRPVWTLG
jgi:hypothetical protein